MEKISVVIMASGFSSRMGKNKLFLEYEGQTFLERTISLVEQLDVYERILVIQPITIKQVSIPKNFKIVLNDQAQKGQSASVRLGTEVATGDGYLYLPVDQPLLDPALLTSLFSYYSKQLIVFPVNYYGEISSPIFFGNKFRSELLNVSGKTGGREVRQRHKDAWRKIWVKDPKKLIDIDTIKNYHQLLSSF